MPGPSVHYIVGEKLSEQYPNQINFNSDRNEERFLFNQETLSILKEHPKFVNFGTLGPDFLFFNVRDWPVAGTFPVKLYIKFAEAVKKVEGLVEETFPKLQQAQRKREQIEDTIDDIVDNSPTLSAIRTIFNDVKAIVELMDATIDTALEDIITSNVNIYNLVSHPIQSCEAKDKWWWFDTLHYRRSGKFAEYLLEHSKDDPELHAYAIGYLSHVAADAVGHPYVNNIVRGPFRTHAQRHNVVEKYQDVSALQHYKSKDFGLSELHREFRFNHNEHRKIPEYETIIDTLTPEITDIGLPPKLTELFSRATKEVFTENGEHLFGGGMEPEEVDAAYRLWYSWFKSSTSGATLPTSLDDIPPLTEEIREAVENVIEKTTEVGEEVSRAIRDIFSGGSSGSSFDPGDIVNLFNKLKRLIKTTIKAAYSIIELIEEVFTSLTEHAIHFLLNQLYQAFYSIYDYFKLSVSLNGLSFPSSRYLDDEKIQHMLNPNQPDVRGRILNNTWPFPLKQIDTGDGWYREANQEAHLVYPTTDLEEEEATPAPFSYSDESHDYFIDKPIFLDPSFIEDLNNPIDLNDLSNRTKKEVMGNACELTGALYHMFENNQPLPDINLDADRGIAYPCWESETCSNDNITEPVNLIINN